jgi:CO/xanthine dehydrogenase FAD-binding subunit
MALDYLKEYWRPTGMDEALALLGRRSPRTVPLGGGSYLTSHRDPEIEAVVDLGALGLETIEQVGAETRVGAMVRLDSLAVGALQGRSGRILAQVARRQTSWQVRLGATLGGALVTGTFPELDAILWVLDAGVILRVESVRTIAFSAFADERDHLPPGALLTGVALPGLALDEGVGTARVSRTPADYPTTSAAAYVKRQQDRATALRLVITGAAKRPIQISSVEQALAGHVWSEALLNRAIEAMTDSLSPPADIRGSEEYRRAMLGVCARQAMIAAWGDANGWEQTTPHRSAAPTVREVLWPLKAGEGK